MTDSKIDIRSGALFPWHFQFIAVIILMTGVILFVGKPVMGLVLMIAAGFILTAASGTEIDPPTYRYREYTSFYFILKNGRWKPYSGIEKLFINSTQKRSQLHTAHTSHSSIFIHEEFNGYLKFTDGTKIHLLSSRKKGKLTAKLNQAATRLQAPLYDTTD